MSPQVPSTKSQRASWLRHFNACPRQPHWWSSHRAECLAATSGSSISVNATSLCQNEFERVRGGDRRRRRKTAVTNRPFDGMVDGSPLPCRALPQICAPPRNACRIRSCSHPAAVMLKTCRLYGRWICECRCDTHVDRPRQHGSRNRSIL
jgi:hypothetical protein